jgi:UDPglucose 6-dehydrogenase
MVGLGYVGLCTGVCLAARGFLVYGLDIDEARIKSLSKGKTPFYEPGLDGYLKRALRAKRFVPRTDYSTLSESDYTFISVGTPGQQDGRIDLTQVKEASQQVGRALSKTRGWHTVVIRSTVIPTTTEKVLMPIIETESGRRCGSDWGLCVNPEFLREGSAINDTLKPDRIVIGQADRKSGSHLQRLYRTFLGKTPKIVRMNLTNAEFVKYSSNAFLAMKISFSNTVANLCQTVSGSDVLPVCETIGLDNRIGSAFLSAGLGYGGSCLPKDVKAFSKFAEDNNVDNSLLIAAHIVNVNQPLTALWLGEKMIGKLSGKRVAVLGLAFKPDSDDVREAVSVSLIRALLDREAKVVAYDPMALENAKGVFGGSIEYASSALECIKGSDLCILVTEWQEFKRLRANDFKSLMHRPAIIDGRRLFNPAEFEGLDFVAIGRG